MRRLFSLVKGLGPGSALLRAQDPAQGTWGNTEELLASLIEVVDLSNRLFYTANYKGPALKPIKVKRPYPTEEKLPEPRKPSSTAEIRKAMGSAVKYQEKE